MSHYMRHDTKTFLRAITLSLVSLFLLIIPHEALADEPLVLVLHSYHKGYHWTDSIMNGIEATLDDADVEIAVEYMDTKRHDPSSLYAELKDLYRQKYTLDLPSVVICADDNALIFMLMYRDRLFPGIPVIFCGINNLPNYNMRTLSGFTGVVENFDWKSTLDIALNFHPKTTHVAIISDDTPSSRASLDVFRALSQGFKDQVSFIELKDLSREELLESLNNLPTHTIIMHNNFFRDRKGQTFDYKESIELVADNTDLPMYTAWDWYLGHGVVGGMMASGKLQGQTAARMALTVLAGTPADDIPTVWDSPNQYMFDYKQLKRLKISASSLPPQSLVVNEPETFYFRHKRYIWTAISIFSGLTIIIALLIVHIAHRRRTESELRAIFDNSLVGIIYLKGGRTIAKINKRVTDILGYHENDLIGREAVVLHINQAKYDEFGTLYYDKLVASELMHVEFPLRHRDGNEVWCQFSGKALYPPHLHRGVIWAFDDITESRNMLSALDKAREELEDRVADRTADLAQANDELKGKIEERDLAHKLLHESEQKYYRNLKAVFGSLPEAIVTVDQNMSVIEWNKSFESIAGLRPDSIRGRKLDEVAAACSGAAMDVVQHTLNTQEGIREQRVECTETRPSGQVMVLSTAPFFDPKGLFAGAVLVIRDITRLVALEQQVEQGSRYRNLIGQSESMRELFAILENLSDYDTTVLIQGESGTGKELVAEALHHNGPNAKAPFIKVNCSALSESLLESELFGHVKGAFTGAYKDKTGRFEAAEGGTVFLDEIGDVSPTIQLKLLRFLESREFERVGESRTIHADVRILAATHVDLTSKVAAGDFREDLFYRLKVMVIQVPPLRERVGDIKPIVEHFVRFYCKRLDKQIRTIDDRALALLMQYYWPGNVRELKHAVEHAVIVCQGAVIRTEHLPQDLRGTKMIRTAHRTPGPKTTSGRKANNALTKDRLLSTLEKNNGNKTRTAEQLGISRRHLYRKLDDFDLK